MGTHVTVIAVEGLPEVHEGDDLAALIAGAVDLADGDVVIVSQKVVSKAEGAVVTADSAAPSVEARRSLARAEADEIVVDSPAVLIVRTRHGLVCANAGIDASNVGDGLLTLLPRDPDASARAIRDGLQRLTDARLAVIVADTFGRPWRTGQTEVAIGAAGLAPIRDERGGHDLLGRPLEVTQTAVADELAAAADLVRTKAAGVPVVVVRGFPFQPSATAGARDLVRPPGEDLFRRGAGMLATALTQDDWPATFAAGASDAELDHARDVAPALSVRDRGAPAVLEIPDALTAGLAAAVLADHGLRVRWRHEGQVVILEAGRPGGAG